MVQRRDRSPLVYIQRFNAKAGLPRLEVRSIVFFIGLLFVVGLAGWLYLHQASEVAAYMQQIRRLQGENEALQQEILALRSDVAVLGSLSHVQELGVSKGYLAPPSSGTSGYLLLPYRLSDVADVPALEASSGTQGPLSPDGGVDAKGLGRRLVDQLKVWMSTSAR
jgi:cell division protein FtsB